jgi:hypothetical protein
MSYIGGLYPISVIPNDLDTHYKEITKATSIYRGMAPHHGAGYAGPWIENYFIDRY